MRPPDREAPRSVASEAEAQGETVKSAAILAQIAATDLLITTVANDEHLLPNRRREAVATLRRKRAALLREAKR